MKKPVLIFLFFMSIGNLFLSNHVSCQETKDSCTVALNRLDELYKDQKFTEMFQLIFKTEKKCLEAYGYNSINYSKIIIHKAFLYQITGQYKKANEMNFIRREIVRKINSSIENEEYGTLQSNIGIIYTLLGDYEKAAIHNDSAIWIALKTQDNTLYGYRIFNKGMIFQKKNNPNIDSAQYYVHKSISILRKCGSTAKTFLMASLNGLGVLELERWQLDPAIAAFTEALDICVDTFKQNHIYSAALINNLGGALVQKGEYIKGEFFLTKAANLFQNLNGVLSSSYAMCLINLFQAKILLGKYDEAGELVKTINYIYKLLLPNDQTEYLISLSLLHTVKGEEAKAQEILRQSISELEKTGRSASTKNIMAMFNLGAVFYKLGNFKESAIVFQSALKIANQLWPDTTIVLATYAANLALVYSKLGQKDEAQKHIEKAILIAEKYADGSPILAGVYYIKGGIDWDKGQYADANKYFNLSLQIYKKATTHEKIEYCTLLSALANIQEQKGHNRKAEKHYQQAIQLMERGDNCNTPEYLELLNDFAKFQESQGKYVAAFNFYKEVQFYFYDRIDKIFSILSENGKERFLLNNSNELNYPKQFMHQYVAKIPEVTGLVYNNELMIKGLLLHSAQEVAKSIQLTGDTALLHKFQNWKTSKQILARQYSLPQQERQLQVQALDSLSHVVEEAERELADRSKSFQTARMRVHWQDVQKRLKADEAAIEFITYPYRDTMYYAALIIKTTDKQPQLITLSKEEELASAIQRSKMTSSDYVQDVYNNPNLYRIIWQPLESHLIGVKTIHYAPIGLLHGVSFSIVHISEDKLLTDRFNLHLHSSTREVVTSESLVADSIQIALACGGILYDTLGEADTVSSHFQELHTKWLRTFPRAGFFRFLPNTDLERKKISEILHQHRITVLELSGYAASEERVKYIHSQTKVPDLVHFATHGFYDSPKLNIQTTLIPLLEAGLVLAGAEEAKSGKLPPPNRDDGLLHAYEIADLNFSSTKLAVLSACVSGLGDIRGNEGVFGLQRAFKVAGVKHVLMSLWEVDDAATLDFMTTFYQHFLGGMEIRNAFDRTQQEMRAKYPDPYLWGAWVLN